ADLIAALDCQVVIAGQNKLGVINHTLLTSGMLALYGVNRIKIVLAECKPSDWSARTNAKVLAEMLWPMKVIGLPFLGVRANTANALRINCNKIKRTLARLSAFATVSPLFKRSGKRLSQKSVDRLR